MVTRNREARMLSDRHQTKLKTHHRVLDWDKSGFVGKDDFEQIAVNFAKLRGEEAGSPTHEDLLTKFRFVWTTFWEPADTSEDGNITPEEFVASITAAIDAGVRSDDTLLPMLFDIIDSDGSGKISLDEHQQFFEAFGIDVALSPDVFRRLDTNGDGSVSREEFLEAGAKFFFFDEEDAPGNHFWGPVEG
jgi:Ca2+-binding EF-hand superfamily protein